MFCKNWLTFKNYCLLFSTHAGLQSTVSSMSECRSRGLEFDSQSFHITFMEIDHEMFSGAILPLQLIQEEEYLSVTGKSMCLNLPRNIVSRLTGQLNMTLTFVLLIQDRHCFWKQCRSRSDGFWRSHLIRIFTGFSFSLWIYIANNIGLPVKWLVDSQKWVWQT